MASESWFIELALSARLKARLVVHADDVQLGAAFDRESRKRKETFVQLRFKLEKDKNKRCK